MKTHVVKAGDIRRDWFVLDAQDLVLGRVASQVAHILKGKHKPTYSPHLDTGDHVVVINVEKLKVTGKKAEKKQYFTHSMYPGGMAWTSFRTMSENKPDRVLYLAVKGMLPRNRLGRAMMTKLKIYAGAEHPHVAQSPRALTLPY
ncbi:MAG: 50S ribosomal protein L13 [Candidatus Eisenbacteria bacterium]|jgi:large subunit ribosomal protein L13